MKRRALLLAAMFVSSAALAATEPVRVSAIRATPTRVTIGDEIRLLVQIERPKTFEIVPPSDKMKLDPFEIKSVEALGSQGNNRVRESFAITVTAFKLGDLMVPSFPVVYKTASGEMRKIMTEPLQVKIVSVGKKKGEKYDIRPIKGPVAYAPGLVRNVLLGLLAAILFFAFVIRPRQKKAAIDREALLPPDSRARLELDRLKKRGLLGQRKEKEHYSEVSDILRRYLERRLGVEALEKTTAELMTVLKARATARETLERVKNVLENADLVKFAKYEPPVSLSETLEADLLQIVRDTSPAEGKTK